MDFHIYHLLPLNKTCYSTLALSHTGGRFVEGDKYGFSYLNITTCLTMLVTPPLRCRTHCHTGGRFVEGGSRALALFAGAACACDRIGQA